MLYTKINSVSRDDNAINRSHTFTDLPDKMLIFTSILEIVIIIYVTLFK